MSSNELSSKNEHYHGTLLPAACIPFSSSEGRTIIKEALKFRHMECYFKLMPQLTTQLNPECGAFACLEMVLNALNIDPGVEWRYPWRWYRQSMLEKDLSSEPLKELSLEQFVFLASLNPVNIFSRRLDNDDLSLDDFREIIKKSTEREDVFVVVRYSRSGLGLHGGCHFSCVGGYNNDRDLILVLDTARFQYPPHWAPLDLMFHAMSGQGDKPGTSGGLVSMSRCVDSQTIVFHLAPDLSPLSSGGLRPDILKALKTWMKFLDQRSETELTTTDVSMKAIGALADSLIEAGDVTLLKACRLDRCYLEERYTGDDCVICALIESLENTVVFACVTDALQSLDNAQYSRIENVFSGYRNNNIHHSQNDESECFQPCPCDDIRCCHFLTFFLLSWPYLPGSLDSSCFHYQCQKVSDTVLENTEGHGHLTREVEIVRKQLTQLMGVL